MSRFALFVAPLLLLTACVGAPVLPDQALSPAPFRNGFSLYAQSRLALNEGRVEQALALLREAQHVDPRSGHLLTVEAEIRVKLNQIAEALALVERAIKIDPEYRDAYLLAGTILAGMGKDREAAGYLRKVVTFDPAREEAGLQLAASLLRLFEYEESVNVLKELVRLKPDSALGHYYLGKTYSQMKLYREAVGYYKRALDLRPDFAQAAVDRAVSLEALGEYEQAITGYKEAIEDSENRGPLINHLIQLLIQQRRYEEALTYLNRLSEMGLGSNDVKRKTGLILLELGRNDDAIKLFQEMLTRDPDAHLIRFYLASAYEEKGDFERARSEFVRIPAEADSFADAQGHLAYILKEQGKKDEAVALLRKGIELRPDRLELYLGLATLYGDLERDTEGLQLLLGVEERFAREARFHFRVGVLFDKLNNKPDSIRRMKRVIELNPQDSQALNYLGYTYAEMGINLEEALGYIKRALAIRPDDGFFIDSLGWVYYQMKRYDEAVVQLERAVELIKDDPTVLEHLGDAYLARKESKRAIRMYKRALELDKGKKELHEKLRRLQKAEP